MKLIVGAMIIPCAVLFIAAVASSDDRAAKGKAGKRVISANDLSNEIIVIGRLGKPLCEMMTIQGSWIRPGGLAKDNSPKFIVTEVDGKKLAKSVGFDVVMAKNKDGTEVMPREGERWTLRGYETGSFVAVPPEYWKELGTGPPAMAKRPGYPFVTELVGVVQD